MIQKNNILTDRTLDTTMLSNSFNLKHSSLFELKHDKIVLAIIFITSEIERRHCKSLFDLQKWCSITFIYAGDQIPHITS